MKLIVTETSNTSTSLATNRDDGDSVSARPTSSKRVTFPDEDTMTNDEDDDDVDQAETSFVSITTTSSVVDNRVMKRKIVR